MQFKTLFVLTLASGIRADDPAAAAINGLSANLANLGMLGTKFDGSFGSVTNILDTGRKIISTLATTSFVPDAAPPSPEVQQERLTAANGLATTVGSVSDIGIAFQRKLTGLVLAPSRPILKTVIESGRGALANIGAKYMEVATPEQKPAVKGAFDSVDKSMNSLIASFN